MPRQKMFLLRIKHPATIESSSATVLALVRHQEQIDRTNIIAGVLIFASIILVIREANLRGFYGMFWIDYVGVYLADVRNQWFMF